MTPPLGSSTPTSRRFTPGEATVHHDPIEVARITRALRSTGRRVVLVPTMGALHAGHLELVRNARRVPGAIVVVSIFVNPLQFGTGEDLDAYPRTLDHDTRLLREAGVDIVFAPSAEQMYPHGRRSTVHPGPLGDELEGAVRPGHFAGMLTVVAKLLTIVGPDTVFMGEKDFQQLTLVRQLVLDLNLEVRVVGVPTVREPDGLAMSSRNAYLDESARRAASVLAAALVAAAHVAQGGAQVVLDTARAVLAAEPTVIVEYLELRGKHLGAAPVQGDSRLLVAARVGTTRLIDNVGIALGTGVMNADPTTTPGA